MASTAISEPFLPLVSVIVTPASSSPSGEVTFPVIVFSITSGAENLSAAGTIAGEAIGSLTKRAKGKPASLKACKCGVYHIGPKLYWGDKTTWFTLDMQYFGVLGKIDTDPSGAPIGQFYTNAGYLGVGYCYTGSRGFFFNPQFIVEGDEYYKSLNFGLSLGIGYCF